MNFNTTKVIHEKPTANTILNSEAESFFRSRTKLPILTTTSRHTTRNPSRAIRQEKEIKSIQIRKEVKLSLFAEDIILCRKP